MTDKKKAAALAAVSLFIMDEEAEISRPAPAPWVSPWPAAGRDAIMGMRQLVTLRLLKRV